MPSKQRRFTNTRDMREGLGRNHASGKRVYMTEETARCHREDRRTSEYALEGMRHRIYQGINIRNNYRTSRVQQAIFCLH